MKNKTVLCIATFLLLITSLSSCKGGLSSDESDKLMAMRQKVEANWSRLEGYYQRRFDLYKNILNKVKTLQNQALHQQMQDIDNQIDSLQKVKVDFTDEKAVNDFSAAQIKLKEHFQIFIDMVNKTYPELKADYSFSDVLTHDEGIENRIWVAKKDFVSAVKVYNNCINKFGKDKVMSSGFKELPQFHDLEKDDKAPNIRID